MASRRSGLPCALVALAGCATAPTVTGLSTSPTEVAVRPEDFLDGVDCSNSPGAMQSYVVTLTAFEDTSDAIGFTLPSSQPTPCSSESGLQTMIVPGQLYVAEVDGYEQPAASLAPFGGSSSGSREMVDAKGAIVAPRWTTRCGLTAASAVVAFADQTNYVVGCLPMVDHKSSVTALALSPSVLAPGGDPCTVAKTFDFQALVGPLEPVEGMACNAPTAVVAATAGVSYQLYAHARKLDGTSIGAACTAVAQAGKTVTPSCDAPSTQGSATIDLAGVMSKGKPACPAGMLYDVVSSKVLNDVPLHCGAKAQIGPFDPGLVTFAILVYDGKGQPGAGGASCAVDVFPGLTSPAQCK